MSDRAASTGMSLSGRFTPAAPAASAMSHRELTTTGTDDKGTRFDASSSMARAVD